MLCILLASNNTGVLNTCTWLWLTESEQVNLVDSIKDVVRSSVTVPEFNKHLKKAGGHIDRNVVEITIKMKKTLNDQRKNFLRNRRAENSTGLGEKPLKSQYDIGVNISIKVYFLAIEINFWIIAVI